MFSHDIYYTHLTLSYQKKIFFYFCITCGPHIYLLCGGYAAASEKYIWALYFFLYGKMGNRASFFLLAPILKSDGKIFSHRDDIM